MRSEWYQYTLIGTGIIATVLFGVFWKRELYPEYKIYQNDYLALEKFRSTYSSEPVPPFQKGIKQIVFERKDNGPPGVERCVSCHVALDIPYFSPTLPEKDANGGIVLDAEGRPVQIPNEDYIWKKLDEKIAELKKNKDNAADMSLAEHYETLKTAHVGEYIYDVTKALRMHPLIGQETRPFEYHPLSEYGCLSCHNGNGQGLTTDKAHGPVFDAQYDIEFEGPEPKFTEADPLNDPLFASEFNHKPGPSLVFQTTPLFTGALVQAKCTMCHQSGGDASEKVQPTSQSSIDLLTHNYQRGRQLFVSQACYACHKIAGFSRGGVGPELTHEGLNYPWFIKQSIVWPQADTPASTMPNYHLDHEELQDLVTYLLAQIGERNSVSPIAYKIEVKEWEAGKKVPWEKPVTPAQEHDLRYGMKVFAMEGCAACHRLKGFESDVGYKIELNAKPDFQTLENEHEWFQALFPESIAGSELVTVLDSNKTAIDEHIVHSVRKGSILEEIENEIPGQIESLYTPFKYAARAKNHEFLLKAEQEKDPKMKAEILIQLEGWKEQVHRVLMLFVQEYGLGRLIGPRPNWSGVYRTDEWLMEHFHNPSSHVPRSIMPAFPFDDSKFYALTNMLDKLGVHNRNAVRQLWEAKGFSPSQAFHIHCSQCHGDYKQGNGPVSEWIYPIPKNLNNAVFLRNLTKEQVIESITHGVKGTPMPPWGEVAAHKPYLDHIPVLNEEEIKQLADWLFSSLQGGQVIKGSKDVQKWQYTPADVIQELIDEGNQLKGKKIQPEPSDAALLNLPTGEGLWASLQPVVAKKNDKSQEYVGAMFDKEPSLDPTADPSSYYIKKEYYTPENIEAGRKFFEMNCAVCHGTEADGRGIRAEYMQDAKPRMLINLDWLQMRDDLRLLRSIKYGVPGTAMTPWGDLTSSLQRLQLVIFIRSLTQKHLQQADLTTALYQAFDTSLVAIHHAREQEYQFLAKAQMNYDPLMAARRQEYDSFDNDKEKMKTLLESYEKELEALAELKKWQGRDNLLINLEKELNQEKEIYQRLGNVLLNGMEIESDFKDYLQLIELNKDRYAFDKNRLTAHFQQENSQKGQRLKNQIVDSIDRQVQTLQNKKNIIEGKIYSTERQNEIKETDSQITNLKKLKEAFLSALADAARLTQQQQEQYSKYEAMPANKS